MTRATLCGIILIGETHNEFGDHREEYRVTVKMGALDGTASESFDLGDVSLDSVTANPETSVDTTENISLDQDPIPDAMEGTDDFFGEDLTDELLGDGQADQDSTEDGVELVEETIETKTEGEVEDSNLESEQESSSEFPEVSINAMKKEHKIKLDPEDVELRRTLQRGLKFEKTRAYPLAR